MSDSKLAAGTLKEGLQYNPCMTPQIIAFSVNHESAMTSMMECRQGLDVYRTL